MKEDAIKELHTNFLPRDGTTPLFTPANFPIIFGIASKINVMIFLI